MLFITVQATMHRRVQYVVLLERHAAFFRQPLPLYYINPLQQWVCEYLGNQTTVAAAIPRGRFEAARLMWLLTRFYYPFPPRYTSLSTFSCCQYGCRYTQLLIYFIL